MRYIAYHLLGLGLNHVFEKFVCQFFVLAATGNHQMIDPACRIFLWNGFADGKAVFFKLVGHERPAHCRRDFVVLEQVRKLATG